jgi:phenylacetate-CoA ligase
MFVHPGQISQIASRFPEIKKVRLVLTGRIGEDKMNVYCELADGTSGDGVTLRVADAVRDVTRLRADIQLVVPGSLADDGKLIEDARDYS